MEYGGRSWITSPTDDLHLHPFEVVQKKAWELFLDIPGTTSRESLRLASGVI